MCEYHFSTVAEVLRLWQACAGECAYCIVFVFAYWAEFVGGSETCASVFGEKIEVSARLDEMGLVVFCSFWQRPCLGRNVYMVAAVRGVEIGG